MVLLSQVISLLDSELSSEGYDDYSLNGLQVEASPFNASVEVKKVGLAVDSGLSVLQQGVALRCQLLIVHHGLFWGASKKVSGVLAKQLHQLITGGCSLYASHLPLDGHPTLGNAVELGRILDLQEVTGFLPMNSQTVGISGTLSRPTRISDLLGPLKNLPGSINPIVLPFGPSYTDKIAIVTGSGASALPACRSAGISTLISGEGKQEAYHAARDLGLNCIFAGHYATETLGVQAVGQMLEKLFGVQTVFIDQPTGF